MKPFRAVQINRSIGQWEPLLNSLEMKGRRQAGSERQKING